MRGSYAARMLPKPPALIFTPLEEAYPAELPAVELALPGSRKLAWLKILKNSARNCSFQRSVMGMFFEKFKSKFKRKFKLVR